MSDSAVDLSLVLACYNEGPLLVGNLQETVSVLDTTRFSCELILVDDASMDQTKGVMNPVRCNWQDEAMLLWKRPQGSGPDN